MRTAAPPPQRNPSRETPWPRSTAVTAAWMSLTTPSGSPTPQTPVEQVLAAALWSQPSAPVSKLVEWRIVVQLGGVSSKIRTFRNVLVLVGGGLSLARAMDRSGLATWIGSGVSAFDAVPSVVIIALVATLFVFLTEVTSNTATSTMAMPIMAGVAAGLGFAPVTLMAVAALSAAMAFMLPVATPPNAIVFGSGYLTIPQMVRSGIWMNVVAIVLITVAASTLIPLVLAF